MDAKPHVMCIPFPAQGHMNSMLKLAKLLHSNGFIITFVCDESTYSSILSTSGDSSLHGSHDFYIQTMEEDKEMKRPFSLASYDNNHLIAFRSLMLKLHDPSSGVPPVTCIISDIVFAFTYEAAAEFHLPHVTFSSLGAFSFMGFLHYKQLIEQGLVPLKSESDVNNGYLDTPIDWIPGMKNINLRDLPSMIRTTDPNDIALNFMNHVFQKVFQTSAIIINTFDELEGNVLEAMAEMLPPIYTVGPLSLVSDHCSSFWKEDMSCLEWLDGRQPNSVIYVNFGSFAELTKDQLIEFALGLVDSEHDFLWIIRQGLVKGNQENGAVLPAEILREMKGRGLITGWCGQEKVLSHPSMAGFLTHSGWNSTLESISVGLPMLCWPYYGDQPTNCHYVCKEWGIGMEIEHDVKREKVASLIKELMSGEKGKEMKEKALEWKECAFRAIRKGGSSFSNVEKLVKEVLRK
ncbi:putative 7-deoxyloganetin glucosyltransferase [Dioscorea sansibarensis]